MSTLYPHQIDGVTWLTRHPRALLADDQGLGKTIQVIVAADLLDVRRMLIVCPTVVLHNWAREIGEWSATRSVQVITAGKTKVDPNVGAVIVSHGLLLNDALYAQLTAETWGACVLDEAHFFRNPKAERTQRFYGHKKKFPKPLARRTNVLWTLTGTPMPNHPGEIWTMLAGVDPQRLTGPKGTLLSYRAFCDRFLVTQQTRYGERVLDVQNDIELRRRLQGFALRRLKSNVLDLPELRFGSTLLTVTTLPTELRKLELAFKAQKDSPDFLEWLREQNEFSTWRRLCGVAKTPPAAELIENDLELDTTAKAVVFCHHRDVAVELKSRLHEFNPVELTGGMHAAHREASVQRFQADPRVRVCVAQIVAGGTGVTLTAANLVYFVEQSFVPGDNSQATDRCYRIGQKRSVLVRSLALAGSIDELLTDTLNRKTAMVRKVMRS